MKPVSIKVGRSEMWGSQVLYRIFALKGSMTIFIASVITRLLVMYHLVCWFEANGKDF